MSRKIFIILLFTISVYGQIYKTDLPKLVRGYQPFEDSLTVLILAVAPGGSGDTTHYVLFSKVIGLQDTINTLRGLIGTGVFDTTFVYQAIALKLAKLDFEDSLYKYIAFSFGNDDSLVTGSQVTGYVEGKGYALWTAINDSNFVRTSETTNWDKTASDDLTTATNFSGDVTGQYNSIAVTDDSHNHVINNTDSLRLLLNSKLPLAGGTITGNFATTSVLIPDEVNEGYVGETVIILDATSTEVSANIEDGSSYPGTILYVKVINIDNGASLSGTIDGGSGYTFTSVNEALLLKEYNASWYIIGKYSP